MAIDTAARRCSAIATRRLPWLRRFAPIPDGTLDQGDRQQLGCVYRGIAASSPAAPGTPPRANLTLDFGHVRTMTLDF